MSLPIIPTCDICTKTKGRDESLVCSLSSSACEGCRHLSNCNLRLDYEARQTKEGNPYLR